MVFCKAVFLGILHRKEKQLQHHFVGLWQSLQWVKRFILVKTHRDTHRYKPTLCSTTEQDGTSRILNNSVWIWVAWGGLRWALAQDSLSCDPCDTSDGWNSLWLFPPLLPVPRSCAALPGPSERGPPSLAWEQSYNHSAKPTCVVFERTNTSCFITIYVTNWFMVDSDRKSLTQKKYFF